MNMFSIQETVGNYAESGAVKTRFPIWKMLLLGILAGVLIALSGVTANTAAHTIANAGLSRLTSGLLFAFGLGMVVLLGTELFTGNCLITISVLDRRASPGGMIRNWIFVYLGNFIGGVLIAFLCARFGQFDYSDCGLAVYTIKIAAAKCSIGFGKALVMGILCNLLVTLGVLLSLSAKDLAGRVIGAYIPVCFFVICGFEHSVANMYFISAGLFALDVGKYASAAAATGIDLSALTWGNFLVKNLLPVTIGNIAGGAGVGALMWLCFMKEGKTTYKCAGEHRTSLREELEADKTGAGQNP